MKGVILIFTIILIFFSNSYSQEVQDPCNVTNLTKVEFLKKLSGQVDDLTFRKISFTDFSKFIIGEDNQFGRAINYLSIQVDKPKATLNLYHNTKSYGFFNFLVSGGFENDLFSFISDGKAASSFSGMLSYSWLPWKNYKYYPSNKHSLWAVIVENFDDSIYTKCLEQTIEDLKTEREHKDDLLKRKFKTNNTLALSDSTALIDALLKYKNLDDSIRKLEKIKSNRVTFLDSLYQSARWSTRKWLWLTGALNYGGVGYKYFNENSVEPNMLTNMSAFTRSGVVSVNFLYKSIHGKWYNNLLNNMLLTFAVSYGRQNDFNTLTASDYKLSDTVNSSVSDSSYIRTESYSIYTNKVKEYDAFVSYFEVIKLLGENGTIGLRNRLTWELPEKKSELIHQFNWEFGILFNTTSKKDKDISKVSFEAFVSFKDLGGNNLNEKNKHQKFYERHKIGIRTNLPFRFLSL